MKQLIKSQSPKVLRLSRVALAAGVMAVMWILIDEYTDLFPSAVLVSAITSLVMLIAQFLDVKAKSEGAEVVDP